MFTRFSLYRMPAAALLAMLLLALMSLGKSAAAQDGSLPIPSPGGGENSAPTVPISTDNHTPATASPLSCGSWSDNAISAPGELDYYKIETGPEWSIVVTLEAAAIGSSLDGVLTLYDINGTTVLADQDQFNGNDPRLHWTTSFNNPGGFGSIHYVRVHDFFGTGSGNHFYNIKWEYARYISMTIAGTVDGVTYAPGDILTWSGCGSNTAWSMFFDASDVGINGNIRDFAVLNGNPAGPWRHGAILMTMPKQTIPGFGTLVAQDIALFQPDSIGANTSGAFYRFFDGSDVGLTKASEAIDGLAMIGGGLLLSTTGNASTIPQVIAVKDEDALIFSPSSLGPNTSGAWAWFFDGSDVGVPATHDLNAFWYSPATYFLAAFDKSITLGGSVRAPSQATACDPVTFGTNTSCSWGVSHQGLADPDLKNSGAVLDGYDEGSAWWPAGFTVSAPAPSGATR